MNRLTRENLSGIFLNVIKITDISKSFFVKSSILSPLKPSRKITALNNINLDIHQEEILAILGPNGAGKTTLIKIICNLILPDKGSVELNGNIGYLSGQVEGFYPQLTAKQNLEFFGIMYNLSIEKIAKRINEYSSILEITDLDKPFWHYSIGMRHKIAALRMLILKRDIILMDEPTKSFDPLTAHNFRVLVRKMAKELNKTIVLATHSLEEAEMIADKIIIMKEGEILISKKLGEPNFSLKSLYVNTVGES